MYILLLEACPPHGLPWFKKTLVIQTSEMSPHSLHVHICTHCSFWEGSYLQYVFSVNVCRLSAMRCYMVLCWLLSTVELQTASSLHRNPAPAAQHGRRLLEAGLRLQLLLDSHAQRDGCSTGVYCSPSGFAYTQACAHTHICARKHTHAHTVTFLISLTIGLLWRSYTCSIALCSFYYYLLLLFIYPSIVISSSGSHIHTVL